MTTRKSKRSTKRVENLPSKKLTSSHAKNVRGGAFQAHISIKGKKQGNFHV